MVAAASTSAGVVNTVGAARSERRRAGLIPSGQTESPEAEI
jgi:hypothetical protein